ncbi:hypothetical protein BIW11_06176 [Tropilaelaps mercedesae]|uniref:Uncharacterized protein n=1 Tax=Tropilaelaps mercedesae TaxID=418985 RepID=A0A1V9XZJ3_9ACAR|nr:hypothetical protein BIW11_06176 [Tropilaelaps mercedesae]
MLDSIIADIVCLAYSSTETIPKKMVECEFETRTTSTKITELEENTLSGLWRRREAAQEEYAKIVPSIEILRGRTEAFETFYIRMDHLIARLVQVVYSRAHHLNKIFATLDEETVRAMQEVPEAPNRLSVLQWPREDCIFHDPRDGLLKGLNKIQHALRLYQRSTVAVKHSTGQTDLQFEDVGELERIFKGRMRHETENEIVELTKSIEQLNFGVKQRNQEIEQSESNTKVRN